MFKKYIGKSDPLALINGKVYEVINVNHKWYQIVDETGEDYMYPPEFFVDPDEDGYVDSTPSDFIYEHLRKKE